MNKGDTEDTDRKILLLLAEDGRMSFTDLGKATGLSTSAVHQRVKRLEQRGFITGYSARIDYDQMGRPLTAFISIRPIDPSQPDDSPDRLASIPEIESCWSVAGDESYILKVRVSTPVDLEDLLARIRAAAEEAGVVLTLENHYKDGTWRYPEFAQPEDIFLEIIEQIDETGYLLGSLLKIAHRLGALDRDARGDVLIIPVNEPE